MAVSSENGLRFTPGRVEGLPDVGDVIVFPDRQELQSAGVRVVYRFLDIARWQKRGWILRQLARFRVISSNL